MFRQEKPPPELTEEEEAKEYARVHGIVDDDWQCRFRKGHALTLTVRGHGHAFAQDDEEGMWGYQAFPDAVDRCPERAASVYDILLVTKKEVG